MSETTAGIDRTVKPYQASEGKGALDGRRYLESLRDGREVWYRGQRIEECSNVRRSETLGADGFSHRAAQSRLLSIHVVSRSESVSTAQPRIVPFDNRFGFT